MDINKEFAKLAEEIEKEWHDGHEPQGIDDQYVEEVLDGEEVEEEVGIEEMPNRAYMEKINTLIKKYSGKFKWKDEVLYVEKGIENDVKSMISKSKEDVPTIKVSNNPMREEVKVDELVAPGKKSATGYTLYHKDFSSAMQHAYDHAKKKGHVVDPKEIDDKVAVGPKKPSKGKVNRYALKAGRKTVQIQVTNLDNKAYELNMYIEDYDKNQLLRVQHDEKLIAEAGDICSLDKSDLRSKSMQKVYDKKCDPETHKKSIFGKIGRGLELYNQNSIGEQKMEKSLLDTVRSVLMGMGEEEELSDKQKAYRKFFDKALKKFKIKSPADLEDDEAKKKFYDYIDKNWKGEHEEVAVKKKVTEGVDLKKLKKEYEKNEDKNHHTENYLLLAKAFGSSSDVKKVEEIMKRNEKQGSTSKKDMDWMYKNINPYYDKIRNEEVKVEKTVSKLFSHVRKLMAK